MHGLWHNYNVKICIATYKRTFRASIQKVWILTFQTLWDCLWFPQRRRNRNTGPDQAALFSCWSNFPNNPTLLALKLSSPLPSPLRTAFSCISISNYPLHPPTRQHSHPSPNTAAFLTPIILRDLGSKGFSLPPWCSGSLRTFPCAAGTGVHRLINMWRYSRCPRSLISVLSSGLNLVKGCSNRGCCWGIPHQWELLKGRRDVVVLFISLCHYTAG